MIQTSEMKRVRPRGRKKRLRARVARRLNASWFEIGTIIHIPSPQKKEVQIV